MFEKYIKLKQYVLTRSLKEWIKFDPRNRKKENLTQKQRENCFKAYCLYQKGLLPINYNLGKSF